MGWGYDQDKYHFLVRYLSSTLSSSSFLQHPALYVQEDLPESFLGRYDPASIKDAADPTKNEPPDGQICGGYKWNSTSYTTKKTCL